MCSNVAREVGSHNRFKLGARYSNAPEHLQEPAGRLSNKLPPAVLELLIQFD